MSDNKNYYYLKLKDNYFDKDNIKILEAMPNGHIYSLIIIKLYLKSCKHDGCLMMTDRIPYDPEKIEILAKVINHDIDHIKKAIQAAVELDLITIFDTGKMWMTEIQNYIGQSTTEADRKREYRKRLELKETMVTDSKEKGQMSRQKFGQTDLELEKELKKELEIKREDKPAKRRVILAASEKDLEFKPLALLLFEEDQKTSPVRVSRAQQEKKVSSWSRDIRLLFESGKGGVVTIPVIEGVIRWCKNPDNFPGSFSWVPNIRSGKKLRDKFPILLSQYNNWKKEQEKVNEEAARQKRLKKLHEQGY